MKANTVLGTPLASYYQNTPQSISANLLEGLNILTGAYNTKKGIVDSSPLPDIWKTEDGVSIDNSDMKVLLAVRGYNGFGRKLELISKQFPDQSLGPKEKDRTCQFSFNNTSNPTAPWYLNAVAAKSLTLAEDYGPTVASWTKDTSMYKKLLLATKYRQELCIGSPAYLQVFDDNNNMTGYNGVSVKDQIPNIVYDLQNHEAASILIPIGVYRYRVIGKETGTYRFGAIDINNGVEKVLKALNVPITKGEIHEYSVDWIHLTSTTGVTVHVDSNGDGKFDKTITGGATLTASQFAKNGEDDKNAICHRPPGNPGNAHTLYLPASAVSAHLAHGDKLGECESSKGDEGKRGNENKNGDKEKDENNGKSKNKNK